MGWLQTTDNVLDYKCFHFAFCASWNTILRQLEYFFSCILRQLEYFLALFCTSKITKCAKCLEKKRKCFNFAA